MTTFCTFFAPFEFSFIAKGQLISKCLFAILNSPQIWTKKFDFNTKVPKVELFSFVFGENWKHQKRHFKINWALPAAIYSGKPSLLGHFSLFQWPRPVCWHGLSFYRRAPQIPSYRWPIFILGHKDEDEKFALKVGRGQKKFMHHYYHREWTIW